MNCVHDNTQKKTYKFLQDNKDNVLKQLVVLLWKMLVAIWSILIFLLHFSSSQQQQPNIIIIVGDDVGWNDVAFHGSNQVPTPNIDALAYSGVILNNYYVMQMCTPSRSALMTGRHPIHTGMQHFVIFATEPWGLDLNEKLLPEYLKEQGYATHIVGKWHLGFFHEAYAPTFRGFDSHFGYWTSAMDYYTHSDNDTYHGYAMRENMTVTQQGFGEYATRMFTTEAERLISTHDTSRPLFLYLPHLAVHAANAGEPSQAPQETIDLFPDIADPVRRIFAAMLTELDRSVGSVVQALERRGMLENSIIIFTTDNGGCAGGYEEMAASNWPLRGTKKSMWEGAVRGSALIWSPLLRNTPRVSSQLSHIQDWLPTLMAAISANVTMLDLDGVDLWPALNDPEVSTYDNLLINIDDIYQQYALRMGDWKIVKGGGNETKYDVVLEPSGRDGKYNLSAVQISDVAVALAAIGRPLPSSEVIMSLRNEATLVCQDVTVNTCRAPEGETCLFDVKLDPCESLDVAAQHPLVLAAMLQLLDDYNATAVPPRNQPSDPNSNPAYWNYSWTNWADYPPPTLYL